MVTKKGSSHGRSTDRSNSGTVRSQGNGRHSFRLAADAASVERTLMAMQRTAVSLIGFGFTIVQFFDRLPNVPGIKPARFSDAPYYLGLGLIACGILALAVSIWQYHWILRYLWGGSFATVAGITKEGKLTPLYVVTIALLLVGVFAFFAVLLRLV
jgi:putative membrane protein